MINSLPVPARTTLAGPEGTDEIPVDATGRRALHDGSDCPWIACDPQLRAAAAADQTEASQRDLPVDDPQLAAEHARIEAEMLWLVRRGGEPPTPSVLATG